MIGLHDHHRAHITRVARTVEKTFASFSPGHHCDTNAASIEIVQRFPPSVSRVMKRAMPHKRGWWRLANATNEIVRRSVLRPRLVGLLGGDERDHKDTTRAQNPTAGTRRAVPMRVYEVGAFKALPGVLPRGGSKISGSSLQLQLDTSSKRLPR